MNLNSVVCRIPVAAPIRDAAITRECFGNEAQILGSDVK